MCFFDVLTPRQEVYYRGFVVAGCCCPRYEKLLTFATVVMGTPLILRIFAVRGTDTPLTLAAETRVHLLALSLRPLSPKNLSILATIGIRFSSLSSMMTRSSAKAPLCIVPPKMGLLFNSERMSSMARLKRAGLRGSPWRTPRWIAIGGDCWSGAQRMILMCFYRAMLSMLLCRTVSNALHRSSVGIY